MKLYVPENPVYRKVRNQRSVLPGFNAWAAANTTMRLMMRLLAGLVSDPDPLPDGSVSDLEYPVQLSDGSKAGV